ncbi:MAG: tyrosine-protein phosphatase, partial [Kangiellaceae bacterium]|nr:tyrosine-protein phosphatase [Kangiellaceae bacterium]
LVSDQVKLPILIHCTSGKDRTGVIAAVVLKALGISDNLIIQEYMLSDGVSGPSSIRFALDGIGEINVLLKQELVNKLRRKVETAKLSFGE